VSLLKFLRRVLTSFSAYFSLCDLNEVVSFYEILFNCSFTPLLNGVEESLVNGVLFFYFSMSLSMRLDLPTSPWNPSKQKATVQMLFPVL